MDPATNADRAVADRVELALPDLAATRALGCRLAGLLRPGDVIALSGPLGSGKTELARALIRARAGAEIEVPSPSFTLVQDYPFRGLTIRHVDLFRIEAPAELAELGVLDSGPEDALLIEWPEHAGNELPVDRLDVGLVQGASPEARLARLAAGPSWADRLPSLLDD